MRHGHLRARRRAKCPPQVSRKFLSWEKTKSQRKAPKLGQVTELRGSVCRVEGLASRSRVQFSSCLGSLGVGLDFVKLSETQL